MQELSQQQAQMTDAFRVSQLVLIPLHKGLYYKDNVKIDLTPQIRQDKSFKIYPIFNNDGNSRTNGFILQGQNKHIKQFFQCFQQKTRIRLKQCEYRNCVLIQWMAKPFNQIKICSICKQSYVDYLDHIKNRSHIFKSKNKLGTRYIEQLCQIYYQQDIKFQTGKRNFKEEVNDSISEIPIYPYKKTIKDFYFSAQYSASNKQSIDTEAEQKNIVKNKYQN